MYLSDDDIIECGILIEEDSWLFGLFGEEASFYLDLALSGYTISRVVPKGFVEIKDVKVGVSYKNVTVSGGLEFLSDDSNIDLVFKVDVKDV
jgi:hypothetical protein